MGRFAWLETKWKGCWALPSVQAGHCMEAWWQVWPPRRQAHPAGLLQLHGLSTPVPHGGLALAGGGGSIPGHPEGQTQHSLSGSLFWHEVGAAAPPTPEAQPVKTIPPESRPRSQVRTFQSPCASGL